VTQSLLEPSASPAPAAPRDIFIVSNSWNEMGGVARWSHQMAGLFAGRGHRVTQVGIVPAPDAVLDFGAELPYRTVTLHPRHPGPAWWPRSPKDRLNLPAQRREARRQLEIQRAADQLGALVRAAAPGAVVICTQVWAMEWVNRADLGGVPVVGMSHESFEYCRQTSRFGRVKRHYRRADRLVHLTQEDADQWIREGMNHSTAMPNPLPFSPETPSPRTERTVVTVGRLTEVKGYDMLLDAWAEVARTRPDWTLRLVGSGEDETALRKQAAELGITGSVDFFGHTQDVPEQLRRASIYVLSSRGEGFPMTLLEARAFGLPCVAFDCAPGVREIVRDGVDGLLAPLGNTGELARRLGRLMDDRELRDTMGEQGRQDVRRFAPEAIERRWEELFALLER
jgi:glycosyltransferase involved in cell wall biosynthesis